MARLLLAISTLLLFAPVAGPASATDAPGEGQPRRVTAGAHVDLRTTGLVARARVRAGADGG
jgi:hypothetical protein